jgi:hypothetical protein
MENGLTIKCMVKAFSLGLMVEFTMVSTMMTRNKDMVFSLGQMAESMKDTG